MTNYSSYCPHCHSYMVFDGNEQGASCDICGWRYDKTNHEYQRAFRDKKEPIENPYPKEFRHKDSRHRTFPYWLFAQKERRL